MGLIVAFLPLFAGYAAWLIGRHTDGLAWGLVGVLATMFVGPIVAHAAAVVVFGEHNFTRGMIWFLPFGPLLGSTALQRGRQARKKALAEASTVHHVLGLSSAPPHAESPVVHARSAWWRR